ncbi:MAG: divalent-cation tolerance protein CutA [Micavibrio sp.]|nr:MAG: divalent-cation tolerance protein CutA [Micavibrio sp.]
MSVITIYTTCSNKEEAQKISKALVEARLVACANIMSPHEAVYWWEGKVEQSEEVAVIFKTREELFEAAKDKICELHSYDCPCVVAWPVTNGHASYLEWVSGEARSK